MGGGGDAIAELEARLARYPAPRFPVQHATAQFHLGLALAERGDFDAAEAALADAAATFDPRALPLEHGKALNALGAVLRLAGRPSDAIPVLVRAAAAFSVSAADAEQAAARFNLGLVRRECGDCIGAAADLAAAGRLFEQSGAPGRAASAARELGALHLQAGDSDAARRALDEALELARRSGDDALAGDAANVLGLAELAAGRAQAAIEALTAAARASPRSVRPLAYAMAKANLALAHERAGQPLRARVVARQALGIPHAPPAVAAQAQAVLARLTESRAGPASAGLGAPDVVALLDDEPPARRSALVREEVARWLDADDDDVRAEAGAWIGAALERESSAVGMAELLLGALLELEPAAMERVMRALVRALAARSRGDQQAFRAQAAMGAARFHVPQMLRLRDAWNAVAAQEGEPPQWK